MTFQLQPQLARDCFVIKDLELCRLLLMNDKNYPWCILVPMRGSPANTKKEIYELTEAEQIQLLKESSQLSQVMMGLFNGKKMNVAALGNVVPQLHIHHIVRQEADPCWPRPVWGQVPPVFYSDAEALRIIELIKQRL
jgi:diadenosine tetraphosphate (Ap4A) HIT family hydrolase